MRSLLSKRAFELALRSLEQQQSNSNRRLTSVHVGNSAHVHRIVEDAIRGQIEPVKDTIRGQLDSYVSEPVKLKDTIRGQSIA